jgi:hypothetical protein
MSTTSIEFASFFSKIGKIEAGNKCSVWKAQVKTSSGRLVVAFIKHLPPRELFIECITAQLGREIGISIPRPLLVQIFPAHLPELNLKESTIIFGSQDASYPSIQQFTCTEKALDELRRWPDLLKAGCFDEWIANPDRHHGNILYSGNSQFSLIDHSHAIPRNLQPNEPNTKNTLLEILAPTIQDDLKNHKTMKAARSYASSFLSTMNSDWESLTSASTYIANDKASKIIDFLNSRLPALSALIGSHLHTKQGDLYAASA